ncbi:MAG: leucine-rich repeat protein [Bacilli bacterium]|nr:leucine-rich repeat protein [Bacilli bacterium]
MKKLNLVFLFIFFLCSCGAPSFTSDSSISQSTNVSEETTISNNFLESTNPSFDISTVEDVSSPVDSTDESDQQSESPTTSTEYEPDDNVMDNPEFVFLYNESEHTFSISGAETKSESLVFPSIHRSCPVVSTEKYFNIAKCAQENVKSVYIPNSILNNDTNFKWLKLIKNLEKIEIDEENPDFKCVDGNIYDKEMKNLLYIFHNPTNPVLQIPETVESIDEHALEGLSAYEEVRVADSNCYFTSIDGVLFDKEVRKLIFYPQQKKTRYYRAPSGVVELGAPGFQNNPYIENVDLPNGFTTFTGTFKNCTSLINVSIPEGVTRIENIFDGCFKLESLKFPNSLEYLLYSNSTGFKNVFLPKNVNFFGFHFFPMYTESFIVDEENEYYQSRDGVLYSKDLTTLVEFPFLKTGELVIPKQTTRITCNVVGHSIVRNHLDWGDHLSSIKVEEGNEVFYSLDDVLYMNTQKGPRAAFAPGLREELTIHSPVTNLYNYSNTIKKITLGKDVTSVNIGPFLYRLTALEEIICSPDNPHLSVIDGYLFDKTGTILYSIPTATKNVVIPKQTKKIDSYCLLPVDMETLTVESPLPDLDLNYYLPFPNLKKIIVGKEGHFDKNLKSDELEDIVVDPQNPYYYSENQVLYNKEKDSLLWYSPKKKGPFSILSSVHTLTSDSLTLNSTSEIKELIIPSHVKTISSFAISGSSLSLEKIVIPDTVTSFAKDALYCYATHIYFGKNVTEFKTRDCDYLSYVSFWHFANKEEDVNIQDKPLDPYAMNFFHPRLIFGSLYNA